MVQKGTFPQELKDLKAGRQVKASSNIVKLKPVIMDDGVLRVGGRISRAPVAPDAMNPMILPKHHVTTILIRYVQKWTFWSRASMVPSPRAILGDQRESSSEGGYWEMYILQETNDAKDYSRNGRITED